MLRGKKERGKLFYRCVSVFLAIKLFVLEKV